MTAYHRPLILQQNNIRGDLYHSAPQHIKYEGKSYVKLYHTITYKLTSYTNTQILNDIIQYIIPHHRIRGSSYNIAYEAISYNITYDTIL